MHKPESQIYQKELVSQLRSVDRDQLRFWLQKYELVDGKEFLYFYVQGDGLCAVMPLTAEKWNKLEKVRVKKGVTYRGAEFTNLTFDIIENSSQTSFLYKSFDRLID